MRAQLKAAWRNSWTASWAFAKLAAGAAFVVIDGAAALLGDANVQGAVKQYVPDAKWGLVLIGIALVTYVSAAHRGGAGKAETK